MKVRRITLAVLLVLTGILVLQGWYLGFGPAFTRESPLTMDWGVHYVGKNDLSKEQEFVHARETVNYLAIDNEFGQITIRGTNEERLRVSTEITLTTENTEEGENLLEQFQIKESLVGDRLSYELIRPDKLNLKEFSINYFVEVPAGLELEIKQDFGVVSVQDVDALLLDYQVRYTTTTVENFRGDLQGTSEFGLLNLTNIVGSIKLEDSYSSLNLTLKDISEGYNFQIKQNFGNLKDDLGLVRTTAPNQLEARGETGLAQYPVQIESNYSTTILKLN